MQTVVYIRNNLASVVSVSLHDNGPSVMGLQLVAAQVATGGGSTVVARIPRGFSDVCVLDFAFSANGHFVSALGVLVDGTSIWWRYRTGLKDLLGWVTDRDPHVVSVVIDGLTYRTTLQAHASFLGCDDLYVDLDPA